MEYWLHFRQKVGDAMKRLVGYIILAVLLTIPAGAEERSAHGRADQTDEALSAAAPFPTIARDQTRPRQYGTNFVDDPGESGDYAAGQCNCKRECRETSNPYQCKLTGDPVYQCLMSNGLCSDCAKDCGA
jgi:hypothetical protein